MAGSSFGLAGRRGGGRFTVASIGASAGSSDSARPWPRVTR
jgi:hypothetical protein